MKLIFATGNQHKLHEVRSIASPKLEIAGLKDIGFTGELPETHETIEENSLEKAEHLSRLYNTACFAEDTGLIIDALNGEPGVYSARYAGPNATFDDNVTKVLTKMEGQSNRKARFKTVITYYSEGKYVQFEGVTEGEILTERRGGEGFGYDPIFKPDGSTKAYAEMSLEEKNSFSHRKKSFDLFANHLDKITVY
ncbi:MAG TPA: RdgB/HAM1 family non-canonical purine NTP pyrophosphatase [Chitinophagales bacterium]|nr:RdgB/HAM1 family non-canonical purine NTP pyrophosphatase [Chitinophagales bacterium]